MAGKKLSGRMGLTKAGKRALSLAQLESRKRMKASQRGSYHSEFKRNTGYPRKGKKRNYGAPPMDHRATGFVKSTSKET
jgi:hypothetical protein